MSRCAGVFLCLRERKAPKTVPRSAGPTHPCAHDIPFIPKAFTTFMGQALPKAFTTFMGQSLLNIKAHPGSVTFGLLRIARSWQLKPQSQRLCSFPPPPARVKMALRSREFGMDAKLGSPASGISPWMECMLKIAWSNFSRVRADLDMGVIFAMKGSPRGAYFW
ncbi:MAG: hypothetical protein ACI9KN_001923 [Gammaproteobacteria bacterium]|jgi:hypothetical protein